jgi:D-aminoacyl-tRNA deacylase
MRVVLQRVTQASVTIDKKVHGEIKKGILVLLGIEDSDSSEDVEWLCNKIVNLRIFNDENGVMNLSLSQIDGDILVISQFTLHASTKKGNRPSYIKAAKSELAVPLYENFIENLNMKTGRIPAAGIFGADMKVCLTNDGPVTIIIDSKSRE